MVTINKRSIGVSILLSIITLGVYGVYWQYLLVKNIKAIKHDTSSCITEMLCIIFVPFYLLYWWYTRGDVVKGEFSKRNHSVTSNGTMLFILSLFGLGVVAMAIMQNDFNSLSSSSHSEQLNVVSESANASRFMQNYGIVIAFIFVLVFFIWGTEGGILLPMNVNSIIHQNAYVFILATGMLLCILTGGNIDLSVGATMALVAAIGATLISNHNVPVVVAMVVMVLSGIVIGMWQGFWIAYVRIPPFIVTLAGMLTFRGLTNIVLGGLSVSMPDAYTRLFNAWIPDIFNGTNFNITAIVIGVIVVSIAFISSLVGRIKRSKKGYEVGSLIGFLVKAVIISGIVMAVTIRLSQFRGIQVVVIWIAVVVLVYWYITSKTTIGRHFYAVGGNEKAAKLSGINTNRVYFIAYVNMSFLAAIAGMVFSARVSAAFPNLGSGFELHAIASCFIGGASAYGGIGTVPRVILGASLMGIINLGMASMGFDQNQQNVISGLVLLGAVIFDVLSKRKA